MYINIKSDGWGYILAQHSHSGHRSRMKNRFLKTGFDGFEPHEALELLLFYAIPKRDTNKLAHDLIEQFGSIAGVMNAPYELLLQVKGVGEHVAILLKQMPQMFRLYSEDMAKPSQIMDTPDKWRKFFKAKFVGRVNEVLFVAGMDDFARFVACELLNQGSRKAVNISCELIVRFAMRWNVDRIVLAHNHPNGVATPSIQDKIKTQDLVAALRALNMTLVDHFIFGKSGDSTSMREYNIIR